MPRKKLIRQNHFPYHVTSRCNNKEWFGESLESIWYLFISSLERSLKKCPVEIHSFVLMGNHYHLLLSTPYSNIDTFMFYLNRYFSENIRVKTRRINHVFAGRYRWTIINSNRYLKNVYRYIYQNPIRANIVSHCDDFEFSSIQWEIDPKKTQFKLYPIMDNKIDEMLLWLNHKVEITEQKDIQKALKRTYYLRSLKSYI